MDATIPKFNVKIPIAGFAKKVKNEATIELEYN